MFYSEMSPDDVVVGLPITGLKGKQGKIATVDKDDDYYVWIDWDDGTSSGFYLNSLPLTPPDLTP